MLRQIVREEIRAALAELPTAVAPAGAPDWLPLKSCGLRPTTARRLLKAGVIEAARVGREVLVSRASVEKYIASRRVGRRDGDEMDRRLRVVRSPR